MAKPRYNALDAKGWFQRADHFFYTATFLTLQPQQMQFIYARPHIVMKAFAAEAYLKALLAVEGTQTPKIHDLRALFDKLKPQSKKRITEWWNKESKPILDKARVQAPPGLKAPKNLRGALDEAASAFIDWRYHGDDAYIGFSILAFPYFVRRRIAELKPEWLHEAPHPLAVLNPQPEFVKPKADGLGGITTGAAILNPKAATLKVTPLVWRRTDPEDGSTS